MSVRKSYLKPVANIVGITSAWEHLCAGSDSYNIVVTLPHEDNGSGGGFGAKQAHFDDISMYEDD